MTLDEIVDICNELTKDAWKYDSLEQIFRKDDLMIVNSSRNYFRNKRITGSYAGEKFLLYEENNPDSRYIYNKNFEEYINGDEFISWYAKYLLNDS